MKLNDTVIWSSQAHASQKTKEGTIVAVLQPGESIADYRARFGDHNQEAIKKAGGPRKHVSYLVSVPSTSGRGRPRLYWPVVSKLSLKESNEQLTQQQ